MLFIFQFTKNKIKSSLKEEKKQIADEGKEILRRKLKHIKLPFDENTVNKLMNYFKYKTSLDLFYDVGIGVLNNMMIKDFARNRNNWYQYLKNKLSKKTEKVITADQELKLDTLVFGANEEKLNYSYSKCCSPIPGDEVFGFTTIKDGIKIHRQDCPNAIRLQSNFAYRILETKWIDSSNQQSTAVIHIKGIDSIGFINEITQILSNNLKVNIQSMNISSADGVFDGMITVLINDKKNLAAIIENIKKVKGITSVSRKFKST